MKEIRRLLVEHYRKYPKAQIQDIIKLLYQSEFAGGHMVGDEEESANLIRREFDMLKSDSPEPAALEDIGGGLCRMNLKTLPLLGISFETANSFFIKTANSIRGSISGFEKKLAVLTECCFDSSLPYNPEHVENYIYGLKAKGYPPLSHSDEYREAYSPAYRIVRCAYRDYVNVFSRIDKMMLIKKTVLVGIEGNCGGGKSALAELIAGIYDCNVFHMDDYFLWPERRTIKRLKETGGNIDYERFKEEVIDGLESGRGFKYRRYDCRKDKLGEPVAVKPKRLNIIEGSYSMHPAFGDIYDLKIFLRINREEQRDRILKRNGPVMYKRFAEEWIPMEDRYFSGMRIKEQCDFVYDTERS